MRQKSTNRLTIITYIYRLTRCLINKANGVWNGFGQVTYCAGDSLDRAVRLQTVESNNWQQSPVDIKQQKQTTTLPLTTWTGDGQYQPVRRK